MRNKYMLVGVVGIVAGVLLSSVVVVLAGQIDSPAGPTAVGGQMYTLENIYDRLTSQGNATKMTTFTEPASGPGGTMHTLDEIYALAWPARVPKTGQTTSYADYDDGYYGKGVAWPNPRFTDNGDGTVTDNLTGLIWLKNANCDGAKTWANALTWANGLYDGCGSCGGTNNDCDLSDGSSAGDWRLPNVRELFSLIDFSQDNPALPNGHAFDNVQGGQGDFYWSSTTHSWNTNLAWYLSMRLGDVVGRSKIFGFTHFVWPVRGGQ